MPGPARHPTGNPNGIIAVRERDGAVVTGTTARARWVIERLATADGHEVAVTFAATVYAVDERTELRALADVLLAGRDTVTAEDVVRHFAPAMARAAGDVTKRNAAEHWLSDAGHAELQPALRAAAKPVAFGCGVELAAPFDVSVESRTLQADRENRRRAELAGREAAERLRRITTAADAIRAAGDLPAAALLAAVRAEDRGETLRGLLKAGADAAARPVVWAVAGASLVQIDPAAGSTTTAAVRFPPDLGPLRSVTPGTYENQPVLLVGGRGGVALVRDAGGAATAEFYGTDVGESPYGFSSAAILDGDQLHACHAEVGVATWTIGGTRRSIDIDVRGARNLVAIPDGGYAFSVGREVRAATRAAGARTIDHGTADVVGLVTTTGRLVVAREDGTLTVLDAATYAPLWTGRRTGRLCAAAAMHWSGGDRLLLATEDGPIVACGVVDDEPVTHYVSGHRALRAVAASAAVVAAVSADRQRLVLWHAWDGHAPVAEVNVGRVVGNRIADVAVV